MMVPFDASTSQQQPTSVAPPPMPRAPLPPGHHQSQSSGMPPQHQHQQQMNPSFHPGVMHHRPSSSMPPGAQSFSIQPLSPGSRQPNFNSMPNGGHQGQYSLHSPAHQPQQPPQHAMHPSQVHHSGSQPSSHRTHAPQRMPMQQPRTSQHESLRTSSSGGRPQQYVNQGLNGNWQSDKDMPHRREMIQHIVKMLKKDKNGSPDWLNKLPSMAKQLEVSLYRQARSFEAYMDMSTLKQRLQQIAIEVSRKARNQGENRDERPRHDRQPPIPPPSFPNGSHGGSPSSAFASTQNTSSHQQLPSRQVVKMDDINPMVGAAAPAMNGQDIMRQPVASSYMSSLNASNDRLASNHRSSSSGPAVPQNSQDPEWKVRIRHKQQRLLLLHHSAKCPHEDGRCSVTPHCADMKRLWRHMEACKDNNCRIPHCFSSRAILSHYRKCKDPSCPACGPVRETVRKSQQSRTTSSRGNSIMRPPSTGPMMSSMLGGRGMSSSTPSQQPQQHSMISDDPLVSPLGSSSFPTTSSVTPPSFQQPVSHPPMPPVSHPPTQTSSHSVMPSSSHSSMPPPPTVPPGSTAAVQYSVSSSQYRSQNGSGTSNTASQPMFNMSENMMSDPRLPAARNEASTSAGRQLPPAGNGANRNDSEWQKVRHKQQRLLLLRHASRCQFEAGKCPVTPHCASMKTLWEHIAHCKNQQCTVQHCMSSRYVLSHYRRCKDARCPACGPVRETIRKSQEKDRGRQPQNGATFGGDDNRQSGGLDALSIGQENHLTGSMNLDALSPTPESYQPDRSDEPFQHELHVDTFEPEQAPESFQPDLQPEPMESYQPDPKRAKTEHRPSASSNGSATIPSQNLSSVAAMAVQQPEEKPSSITLSSGEPDVAVSGKVASKEAPSRSSEDHSLLNSFTIEELETHISSLNRTVQLPPAKLKSRCLEVLKGLQAHQHGWVFNSPVDPVELGLPDYFEIIRKPMDLGTVHKKIDNGLYHSIQDFQGDVNLTFDNAMTYNEDGSVVHDMAKELKAKFEVDYAKLVEQLDSEDRERRQNERACTLCGCEKLLFEPPVFFCSGANCQSKRIRRNSHFYVGGNNQYYWCNTCFNEIDGATPIEFGDMTVTKADLKKKKNDEVHEESWVQCDSCERWIHQICGLFNTRQNKEHHTEYCCPKCLLTKKRQTPESAARPPKPLGAADLPRTKLSEFLEVHLHKRIAARKRRIAEMKAEAEKISIEEATRNIEIGGPVIVRQVTAMDRKLEVRERMKKRYAYKNYPEEFPYRCKCILVFQNLDGVDVILFALYVYEHGADNPSPNQRAVYISYLDSVHFMRPRQIRTFVYHEILIAYLDHARQKGFATAHLWACPPLKGDDYIFYAKPEDQKTPRDSRLRQWYLDMLVDCQKRNIVGKLTNMYDLYFADESLDATAVPYLEGDYFPGEAENIIKDLEEGGSKKKNGASGKKTKKKQSKSKSCRGTRSTGVDEEALLASGILEGARTLEELDRDQVMVKLGETIQPMKDSFIVAFLNWEGAKEADLVVPDAITKYRLENPSDQSDDLSGNKRKADRSLVDRASSSDESGRPMKVIDDDKEDMDCEFFNNRQAFLNLCRGNHYQFDELRRAKHTSMMVLWHLHNRDAPKFVQQCVACNREILSGKRYHCPTCPDYDLCEACFGDPSANRGACTHQLQAIAVEAEAANENQSSGLTEAQRLQRQRNLMLHIQLIEHASRCNSPSCQSNNCAKMKTYLQHARTCRVKVTGGCKICKRIWTLLRIHAQKCKDTVCPIPQCMAIREKMRQLQKQQQAMDDRRRQEMNRHYRMSMSGAG